MNAMNPMNLNSMNSMLASWQPDETVLDDLPVAYTEVDAHGILRVANQAACRLHRMSSQELIGHSVFEFVPKDEVERDRAEFLQALQSGEDLPVIQRSLYTATGRYRLHEIHRRLKRDAHGNPIGTCCVTFDVSEMDAAHRETRQAMLWLESALTAIPQSVLVTDALGFIRYANRAAERLTGWLSHELLGQQVEKRMPILRAASKSDKPMSFRITLQEPWNGDVDILTRDGQAVSVWLSASPILDLENGYTKGVVIVLGSPRIAEKDNPSPQSLQTVSKEELT